MKRVLIILLYCLSSIYLFSQDLTKDKKRLKTDILFLASDLLEGRAPGTRGDTLAIDYISSQLSQLGFTPYIGDNMVHQFSILKKRQLSPSSNIIGAKQNIDYVVPGYSSNGEGRLSITVVSPGSPLNKYNFNGGAAFIYTTADSARFYVTAAADRGAKMLIVRDTTTKALPKEEYSLSSAVSLPVVLVSSAFAGNIESGIQKSIEYKIDVQSQYASTGNIVAVKRAERAAGAIVIGAHYDHLGMGGKGSGSMRPNSKQVHNGADDNASGVAAVLEIARLLSVDKFSNYDIVFALFGAEERGLLGSQSLADTLGKISKLPLFMINLDMVGRMRDNKVQIGGAGTFRGADSVFNIINSRYGLTISLSKEGTGPSDHSSFYSKGVPVAYFTTGVHQEYHTPDDDENLINYQGLSILVNYIADMVRMFDQTAYRFEYIKVVSKNEGAMQRSSFKVTFGVIPDFTYEEGDGFRIASVSDGKPAQKAGLLAGDVITSIDGKGVKNIYDYMARLGELKKGMSVNLCVKRGEEKLNITIEL